MIQSFEPIYNEFENLFINMLPEYIEKINKEHNDGIILKHFENKKLDENYIKLPFYKITFNRGVYSEKDRIIENAIFNVKVVFKLEEKKRQNISTLWRYIEAVNMMFEEEETQFFYVITDIQENTIYIKIINEN